MNTPHGNLHLWYRLTDMLRAHARMATIDNHFATHVWEPMFHAAQALLNYEFPRHVEMAQLSRRLCELAKEVGYDVDRGVWK